MGRSTFGVRNGSIRPLLLTGALLLGLIASPNVAIAGTAGNGEPIQLADTSENIGASQSSVLPTCVISPVPTPDTGQFVGAVTDGGQGVGGAYVYLIPLSQQEPRFDYEACVITGEDGGYTLQPSLGSHPYIVVVDPPNGASNLSSRVIREQSPTTDPNMSLDSISLNSDSTISGTVEFGGMTFAETVGSDGMRWVLVCAYSTSNTEFLGCGTVRDRGEQHGYSFEIGTPAGVVPPAATIFAWEWHESGGASFTARQASEFSDLNNILIDLPQEDGPWNGCEADQTPTFAGTVTLNGQSNDQSYGDARVSVFARSGADAGLPGWATHFINIETFTDAQGAFELCVAVPEGEFPWLHEGGAPQVQLIVASKDRGLEATVGDTASEFFDSVNGVVTSVNNMEIAMAAPTLRGRALGAGYIEVIYDAVPRVITVASLDLSPQGGFAAAFPFPSDQGEQAKYRVTAEIPPEDSATVKAPFSDRLLPLLDARPQGEEAVTLDWTLPNANLRFEIRRADGGALTDEDFIDAVRLMRTDGEVCGGQSNPWVLYLSGCFSAFGRGQRLFSAAAGDGSYRLMFAGDINGESASSSYDLSIVDGVPDVPSEWSFDQNQQVWQVPVTADQSGPGDGNTGGGGDWNGCDSDQSPTVTGTVTAGDNPYANTKVELFLRQSILRPVPGWAIEPTDYRSVTDSEGNFGFCLDLTPQNRPGLFGEGGPDVVVVAESKDRGPAANYGDSASDFVTLGADGSLPEGANFDIAMAAPTFRGQVGNAGRIELHYAIVDFGFVQRNGRASMDDQGRFATAMPISTLENVLSKYRVEAYPYFTEEVPALAPMIWALADLQAAQIFALDSTLPSATLRVDLRRPDNTEFGQFDRLSSVSLERTGGDCEENNQADRYLAGCRVPVAMSRTGLGARPETPGVYQLVIGARVDGRDLPPTTFMLEVNVGGTLVVPESWGEGSDEIRVAQLADAAITFRPVLPGGQPVSGARQFQVERMTVDTGRVEFRNVDEVRPDDYEAPNSWGWTPTQAGLYRVRLAPPSGRLDLAYTVFYFRVNGTGSDARINGICTEPTGPSDTPSCSDITPISTPDVIFASPNLTFKVCAGGTESNCQSVGSETQFGTLPDLEVRRLLRDGEGRVTDNLTLYRSPVIHEGTALRLTEPTDGITMFEVSVVPPFQNPGLLAPLNMTFLIVSSSASPDGNGWYQCAARDDCHPETGTKLTVTNGVINLGEIVMQESRVVVQVRRPGGSNLGTRSWVQVSRERPCDYDDSFTCLVYVGAQETRLDGVVGFEFEAGVYEIVAEPPRNDTSGLSSGRMRIEVGTQGTVVAATVSGVPQQRAGSVDEPLWLDLRTSNVVATVRAGDSVRSFAQVGVERWNGQFYEWTNIWGFSDRNGVVRLRLEEGQWRLRARPSPMDAGIFTEARLVLVISAAGGITSVEGLAYDGEPLTLTYGVPNLAGVIRNANNDPVPYAGVGLEAWNGQWFGGLSYTNTWADGRFALSVGLESEPRTYRLGIDPPAVISGGVRTIRYLWFPADSDSDKSPCVTSREVAQAAPSTRPASCGSPAVITLDGPNLQGRVIGTSSSGSAPQAAWVYPRRWNGEWFDWVDQWSDARAGIGNFGFILTPGFYEISAEPRPGSGFAKTSIHVNVLEGGALQLCGLTVQSGYEMPNFDSCRSVEASDLVDGRLVIELIGANLRGAVTYTTLDGESSVTNSLREGWVEIFDTTDGQSRWVSSVGLSRTGEFALRLDPRSSTGATKFQVVVSPSNWNPQISALNLGKTRFTLWAQTVGGSTQLCANDPALGECQVIEPGIRSVEMTAGNVRGTVLTPVGSTPVPDAQISVERWVSTGGSGYWEWANEWTNTGSAGGFALSLEEDHHYRLTVRAPWGRADVSPTSIVIRVESGGVCEGAETVTTCDGTFASGPLTVTMGEPNLRGKILIPVEGGGFTAQPNVWVSVERWTGSWWEWTGNSTNASVHGDFGLTVSDGVYRVTVEAPWGTHTSDLSRFSVGVTVSGSTVQWATGTSTDGGRAQLVYPAANAVFTVRESSAGQLIPVRDAWVSVERKIGDQWRWVDINGSSRANGRVALRLPDPAAGVTEEYRLTVNPPWNRGDLPRFTTTVNVNADGVTYASADLQFPSANLSGQILVTSPSEGIQSVPNRWGWVEVRNVDGAWLEGTSTNVNGQFSLYLPNPAGEGATTSYTLVAYSNPSLLSAPPIRMHVTVTGSASTLFTCEYATGGSCLDDGRIAAAFDFIAPNLTVSVIHENQPVQGAFVMISQGGTRVNLITDAAGQVKVNLELGEYSVTVVSTRVSRAGTGTVSVPEAGMANLTIDLTPAGESG